MTNTPDAPFRKCIVVQRIHLDDGSVVPVMYKVYARSHDDAVELTQWWLRWKMEANKRAG